MPFPLPAFGPTPFPSSVRRSRVLLWPFGPSFRAHSHPLCCRQILLVDDNVINTKLTAKLLESWGASGTYVSGGIAALCNPRCFCRIVAGVALAPNTRVFADFCLDGSPSVLQPSRAKHAIEVRRSSQPSPLSDSYQYPCTSARYSEEPQRRQERSGVRAHEPGGL